MVAININLILIYHCVRMDQFLHIQLDARYIRELLGYVLILCCFETRERALICASSFG